MTDPYSVLGITPVPTTKRLKSLPQKMQRSTTRTCTPIDPSAEEHFKEVQAAYSEIMRIKQAAGVLQCWRAALWQQPERLQPAVSGPVQRGRVWLWDRSGWVLQHKRLVRAAELRQRCR